MTILLLHIFTLEIRKAFLINRIASQLKVFYIKPYLAALEPKFMKKLL